MRTETDLRAAMTRLADDPPDAGDVLTAVRDAERPVRPVRRRLVLGIAVATTLATVAVPATIRTLSSDDGVRPQPSAPQLNQSWRLTLSVPHSSGFRVDGRSVFPGSQSALVIGPGDSYCDVAVYQRGVFDTGVLPAARQPVTVQGAPAWYARFRGPNRIPGIRPRIAWEQTPGAWVVVTCTTGVVAIDEKAVALRLANALSTAPQRLAAPFTVGYLPPGLTVDALGPGDDGLSVHATRRGSKPYLVISYQSGGFEIPTRAASMPVTRFTVNGRAAEVRRYGGFTELFVHGAGFGVKVSVTDALLADPATETRRIAEGLVFAADPADQSTWFDGAVAIP